MTHGQCQQTYRQTTFVRKMHMYIWTDGLALYMYTLYIHTYTYMYIHTLKTNLHGSTWSIPAIMRIHKKLIKLNVELQV